jgi:serine/threonine-protein kinase
MSDSESLTGSGPVAPGDVLAGKYRVDRVLGVGGMGVVVAATHLQLDQRVALKFMLDQRTSGSLVERFTREARAAVRLRSDHAARVLDVGVLESGSPYMVIEFLEGDDLAAVLEKRGPLPVEVAVDCVLQACDAVAEAHSLGIVHRDLKPRNLFLTKRNDGRPLVKVLDFGVAKLRSTVDVSITHTSEMLGSPSYMSPEQFCAARDADDRSDIWSLGVILFELLAGRVPFVADTITQLMLKVLNDPPPLLQALRGDLPSDLVSVVDTCLKRDPLDRFQSVAQLALALERFAPPDTRDLARRIGRIAAGSGAQTRFQGGPRPGVGPTDDTLSALAGTHTRAARTWLSRKRATAGLVVGAGIVLAIGTKLALHRIDSAPAPGAKETKAVAPAAVLSGPTLAPTATSGVPLSTLAPLSIPTDPTPSATREPRPTSVPRTASPSTRPARGPANAAASAPPSDEPPRYRTNW